MRNFSLLVHFEERIREVGFSSGSEKEGNVSSLLDAIVKVFADVLPAENPMHQLILQIRNEDWMENVWMQSFWIQRERFQISLL